MHDTAKNIQPSQPAVFSHSAPAFKERLPSTCPPVDATLPEKQVVWRFTDNNPAIAHDFLSHRALGKPVYPGTDECRASSCSVFTAPCKLSKLPKLKEKYVAELMIDEDSGLIKKKRNHIDLWMFASFDPISHTKRVFDKSDLEE